MPSLGADILGVKDDGAGVDRTRSPSKSWPRQRRRSGSKTPGPPPSTGLSSSGGLIRRVPLPYPGPELAVGVLAALMFSPLILVLTLLLRRLGSASGGSP